MADKLADLSPEDKEKRIAELKAKMQSAAQKAKAAPEEGAPKAAEPKAAAAASATAAAPAASTSASAAGADSAAASAPATSGAPAAVATAPEPKPETQKAPGAPGAGANGAKANGSSNGSGPAAVAAAPVLVASEMVYVPETPEQKARRDMNRREFFTYAWGAALGLLLLQGGVGMFRFMYPRFKAGEFGGVFFIGPESALPPTDAPPMPYTAGKFWMVNTTDQGPKALYMVCTHLGCLYKWAQSNNRFECPCHGSKFSREGYYIEGPAPRSLDTFAVTVEAGLVAVNTGKKTLGAPSSESPARAVKG